MNEFIQAYGYLAVFLLTAFDHSGTPLGIMLSIGMVNTGALSLFPTMVVATLGGIAGDFVLFALGYFGGSKAVNFFKRRGERTREGLERAEKFLHKYGAVFLVWGRFMAFVGRYMSLVYGAIRYPLVRFVPFISLSSIAVTFAFGLPLYFLGEQFSTIFESKYFMLILSTVLIVLQITITFWWYARRKGS